VTPGEAPPRVGLGLLKRALLAGLVITFCSAAAVSGAVLLEAERLVDLFNADGGPEIPEVSDVEAGDPRTFLLLGSDQRYEDEKLGLPVRSDTIVLARLNPERDAITMLSLPRDLKVKIPGIRYEDRINAAYANGGARRTVQTVKRLFEEATGEPLDINHVMTIEFGKFRRAINYVGGVYVDVDRRYFNDNNPPVDSPTKYATIDVEPGYQLLRGRDALDYVRYRHGDSDLVRSARQQDFLRQFKAAPGVKDLMTFGRRDDVVRMASRYIKTDSSINSAGDVIALLQLAINVRGHEVREVHLDVTDDNPYVEASDAALRRAYDEFMEPQTEQESAEEEEAGSADDSSSRKPRRPREPGPVTGLEDSTREGEDLAIVEGRKVPYGFYFPSKRLRGSSYAGHASRVYRVRDHEGKRHRAYRLVLYKGGGEYYGVQGLDWKDAPILDAPHDERTVRGRKLKLYWAGSRLRMVAWETDGAVYWVSNTLTRSIGTRQLIEMAASLRRLR
jgi:polyisoprenyl-teichoic acid--peptidoglycan teichoic acid transferase